MTRATSAGAFLLCLGLTVACGRRNDNEAHIDLEESATIPVQATGCLTAAGDQFVLIDLERAAAATGQKLKGVAPFPETETYQLVGNTDELRRHVGRRIRVYGDADPARVAEVLQLEAPGRSPAVGTSGTASEAEAPRQDAGTPQVTTQTRTRFEMARLRVLQVSPTGDPCAAELRR